MEDETNKRTIPLTDATKLAIAARVRARLLEQSYPKETNAHVEVIHEVTARLIAPYINSTQDETEKSTGAPTLPDGTQDQSVP